MEKVIITVAPTGSVPRKENTPYVPVTPDEIAETAELCEAEGASVIHIHCRDAEQRPTSDFKIFRETVDKVRRRTRLVVMTSTSGIAGKTPEERAQPLRTNPEMGSLTPGSINMSSRKPSVVYINTVETVEHLAKTMLEKDIKPEIECFDLGMIGLGLGLAEKGLVKEPLHFQMVMGLDGGVPATVKNLQHMVDQLPPDATWTVSAIGRHQLPLTTAGIILGGHVRVGLEDNLYLSKGKLARNEELVARARHIAGDLQREVATPDEARRILGIPTRALVH